MEGFDFDDLLKLVNMAMALGAMVYAFFANRTKGIQEKFENVEQKFKTGSDRMDRHDARIAYLEQTVKSMPDKDDMHRLQLEMAAQTGELKEMRAVMDGNAQIMGRLETIVTRHEDHLLDGGK